MGFWRMTTTPVDLNVAAANLARLQPACCSTQAKSSVFCTMPLTIEGN